MIMILILCDYPYGKEVSDNVYSGRIPDSANGSSQNKAGFSVIQCQSLGRPGIFALRNNVGTRLFGSSILFLNLRVPPKQSSKILEDQISSY